MKSLLLISFLPIVVSFCWANDIPQGVVNYYASEFGHERPDTLQIVQVDFKGDGSHQYLMTFAKGDWNGPDANWGVVEFQNGNWVGVKMSDITGELKAFASVQFDPADASFMYLPSYKRNGLLAHWRKDWTFTYLKKAFSTRYIFWIPSQVGLTDYSLKKLMDSNKLKVIQKEVP